MRSLIDVLYNQMYEQIYEPSITCIRWHDDTPKYIRKRGQGIVFYTKPRNMHRRAYRRIWFWRRIASLRIFTHTVK